jgi:hypothetical protein
MYKNFYFDRQNNEVHLWTDGKHNDKAYEKFKYEKYAYKYDPNGEKRTLNDLPVSKVKRWSKEDEESGLIFEMKLSPLLEEFQKQGFTLIETECGSYLVKENIIAIHKEDPDEDSCDVYFKDGNYNSFEINKSQDELKLLFSVTTELKVDDEDTLDELAEDEAATEFQEVEFDQMFDHNKQKGPEATSISMYKGRNSKPFKHIPKSPAKTGDFPVFKIVGFISVISFMLWFFS